MNERGEMLNEVIKDKIYELSKLEVGSTEMRNTVDELAILYKISLEEEKNHAEIKLEKESKALQQEDQVLSRYIKLGVDVASIVLPLGFYALWMKRGFKFEEEGVFTSTTFRNLFNCFRPTRR